MRKNFHYSGGIIFLGSYLRRAAIASARMSMAVAFAMGSALADSDDSLRIEAVSNRADLVSGGDVLQRELHRRAMGAPAEHVRLGRG
ncbi:MAG TPA: hypothetical protein VGB36_00225 [Gammaproteobacteria bacterium]